MKYKTTSKAIKNGFYQIASTGYCEAQTLLQYRNPESYSSGVYGWNCDFYNLGDGLCIATGYRSLPENKNVNCSYDLVREFENRAMKAEGKEGVEKVLREFIKTITKEGEK